jgi:glutamine amidotransferase
MKQPLLILELKESPQRKECFNMIAVIDYGMGNLHSVSKALERLEYEYVITDDKQTIEQAAGVILPGVGAFGDAMKQLRKTGLDSVIKEVAEQGKPLLGICLGMQLLFSSSAEGGEHEGLGLLTGHVRRLPGISKTGERYKVPHMGWNLLHLCKKEHDLLHEIEGGYTYFVHSYFVDKMDPDDLIAFADYYEKVPGIVGRKNVMGMQFHPEKSGATGMHLFANFCRPCKGVKVG